jgi:hypothetical protein
LEVSTSKGGDNIKKRCRRMDIVEILGSHVWKWKKWYLLKLFQEGGREDKGEWWREWIQLWYIFFNYDTLL